MSISTQSNQQLVDNNNNTEQQEITQRIYAVQGVKDTQKVNIKDLGAYNIPASQAISDTMVDDFEIKEKFSGHIYGCNITKTFLSSNRELPVMHVDVWFREGQNLMTKLYEIWLKFHVDVDKVTSYEQLISSDIEGHFSLEIRMDDDAVTLDDSLNEHPGNKEIIKMMKKLTKSPDMMELMDSLASKFRKEQANKYDYDFSYRIPEPTIRKEDYS
jgi:hypothetical protein